MALLDMILVPKGERSHTLACVMLTSTRTCVLEEGGGGGYYCRQAANKAMLTCKHKKKFWSFSERALGAERAKQSGWWEASDLQGHARR